MANLTPFNEVNDFLSPWLKKISGKFHTLQFCQQHYDSNAEVNVLAIGKASVSMTLGLLQYFKKPPKQLLCISKTQHINDEFFGYLKQHKNWQYLEASHPIITQSSLNAGEQLIRFVEYLNEDVPLLCLISGGTSSLVEKLPMGITLDFLADLNQYLLASGLAIEEINRVRKQFSLIKDGRLLAHINSKKVEVLYLSDVPDNDVSIIGSGLFKKSPAKPMPYLPSQFNVALPAFKRQELTKKTIQHHVIFDLPQAMQLAKKQLSHKSVYLHQALLFTPIKQTRQTIVNIIKQQPDFDVYIFAGEPSVKLPQKVAKGGRNQHLALSFVEDFPQQSLIFICLGTDGTDGTTNLAGAWADEQMLSYKAEIEQALLNFNSYSVVKKLSLGIKTGATGSNVMDMIFVFRKNRTCF